MKIKINIIYTTNNIIDSGKVDNFYKIIHI